nr:MAG TPA: portal protein [Caudoviricetes sp.]
MGKLRDKIGSFFSRKKKLRSIIREYYGGDTWLFARAYASSIYNIPEVRTAIEAFADIFSTIPKYLERVDKSGNITYLETNASRVLTMRANPLQNATQFWKDVVTRLMLDCNVFIEPIFDRTGELRQLYILPRDNFEFKLYDTRATVTFNGIGKTYDIGNLIYLNRFSDIAGGKRADLGLYETVIQALAQQAINVADPKKPRAIMQGKLGESGNFKEADRKGTMQAVKANFDDSAQGIVYFDSVWEITPINWQENDVNRELMKLVINVVNNYFGITEDIINNKASEIEYEMFIKNKLEPLARQIEQEFTSKLFTAREIEFGNRLEFDTFNLSISTLQAKTAFFSVASRQGLMNIDEMREIIGQPPLPNGLGKMYRVTADTVNIEKVDDYQLSKNGGVKTKEQPAEPEPPAEEAPPKEVTDGQAQ